jgi:hypothetical protein
LPPDGVEQGVGDDAFLADKVGGNLAIGQFFDAFHFFIEAQRGAVIAHVVGERLDHFVVGEFEKPGTLFDNDDAHAERGEHAGVFDADDAAADNDHCFRNLGHGEDLIAVDDVATVDGHFGIGGGFCAGGDHNVLRFKFQIAIAVLDSDVVRIGEGAKTVDEVNAVALKLILNDRDFVFDNMLDAEIEVCDGYIFFRTVIGAVKTLIVETGEEEYGFAHGFAGNGTEIDADSADRGLFFDDGDALPGLGSLNRGAMATRS